MTLAFVVWDRESWAGPDIWWRRWAHVHADGHPPVDDAAVVITPYVRRSSYRCTYDSYLPIAEAIVDGLAAAGVVQRTTVAAVIVRRGQIAKRDGLRVSVVPAARVRLPR